MRGEPPEIRSPDGVWVAYGDTQGVSLYAPEKDVWRSVVHGPYTMPAFSSDGRRLAFDSRDLGAMDVWITDRFDITPPKPREGLVGTLSADAAGFRRMDQESSSQPHWVWRRKVLPELELRDLDGRLWGLDQLGSKVAVVYLWATWCVTCQEQLALIQRLHESLNGRSDTVVLTLNVDNDVEKARKFVTEKRLTMPVLPARDYVKSVVDWGENNPRTWIVAPGRLLTAELRRLNPVAPDDWLKAAREEIERARAPRKERTDGNSFVRSRVFVADPRRKETKHDEHEAEGSSPCGNDAGHDGGAGRGHGG